MKQPVLEQPPAAAAPQPEDSAGDPAPEGTRPAVVKELGRLVVSAVIIGAGVLGMLRFGRHEAPPRSTDSGEGVATVETIEVAAHQGGFDVPVDGVAVPFREIQLAAEVAGRVTFKSEDCRAGNFVRAGTPLLKIDPRTYELEVQRLQRALREAEQNIAELAVEISNMDGLIQLAKADLQLRQAEVARQKRLAARAASTAAESEAAQRLELQARNSILTLENQKRLLQTRKGRLEASRELAMIQIEQAELDLARTEVTAPVDGVIVSEMVEADSYVQRGAQLLTFEDTRQVEVSCSLTMEELYRLWNATGQKRESEYDIPDLPVLVTYKLGGRTFGWHGQLARYEGVGLDEKTRTIACRIVVPEPRSVLEVLDNDNDSLVAASDGPPVLVRGMFVNARIRTQPTAPMLRVPEAVVRPGNRVWLVRDGHLDIVTVVIAATKEGDIILDAKASGVSAGERAVISPLSQPVDGLAVKEVQK